MKIVHIGLHCCYTEGMKYQENELSEQNIRDGHEVLFISNAEKYVDGAIVSTGEQDIMTEHGIRLVRLEYMKMGLGIISQKVRKVKGLYQILDNFAPDLIMSHDLCYLSVLEVVRYVKGHSSVRFIADTHTSYANSGRNWLSRYILHGLFYRWLTKCACEYLDDYYYIGLGEKTYSKEVYGVPESKMHFLPLGTTLLSDEQYYEYRNQRRKELGLQDGQFLFLHSGKLSPLKRTAELLEAFHNVDNLRAKMVLIGSLEQDTEKEIMKYVSTDERILYLGWKNGDELTEWLCAGDLYCQPGSVSATMQRAAGCKNPIMSYPDETYRLLDEGNFIWVQTVQDMQTVFTDIVKKKISLSDLADKSEQCAKKYLDYAQIVKEIYGIR